jgi:hypothetical protein
MQPRGARCSAQNCLTFADVETRPPGKSKSREIVERAAEAGLNFVPGVGGALAVAFVTAVSWQMNQRREEWLAGLAQVVEDLRDRLGDADFETLAENPLFVDAVVTTTRAIDHTHQEEKIAALRNAVLNSAMPGAPDADTHAILLGLVDRLTASHLRFLTMWNDPRAWFESHHLTAPQAGMAGSRTLTVDAGLPEMRGRQDFYRLIATDLESAGLMTANVFGTASRTALMDRLTTELGTRLVEFVNPPRV